MKLIKLATLLLVASFTTAANAMNEVKFQEANKIFLIAVDGDEDNIVDAREYFDQQSEPKPYGILIQTYIGSLETMMAAHVYMPWNKMKHAETGAEQIDDALDELEEIHNITMLDGTPISLRIKSIAAHTYFEFPKFLNRYQDVKDLVSEILESPLFAASNIESQNAIYKLAAAMAEQDDDKKLQADYLGKIK